MKIRYSGPEERAQFVQDYFPELFEESDWVLDLGSRGLYNDVSECEILPIDRDRETVTDAFVRDLENPAPLPKPGDQLCSRSILASHVLEHIDDMHGILDRMAECATRYILIGVPNEYDWLTRYHVLCGKVGDKWGITTDPNRDRHRWRFNVSQARFALSDMMVERGYRRVREASPSRRMNDRSSWKSRLACRLAECGSENFRAKDYWALFKRRTQYE